MLLYPVPIRGPRRRHWAAEVHPQECAVCVVTDQIRGMQRTLTSPTWWTVKRAKEPQTRCGRVSPNPNHLQGAHQSWAGGSSVEPD